MVRLSVCVVRLNGLPAVKLAVREPVMCMFKVPWVKVSLVSTGDCNPKRGSGPRVLLSVVPSGRAVFLESCPFCKFLVAEACKPFGQVLVWCSDSGKLPFCTQGSFSVV